MSAFLEAPFLPDPTRLWVDQIIVMLALLLGDHYRSSALRLLYPNYTPEDATYIWSNWEPHTRLPSSHPLTERALARDRILAMLYMDYTSLEAADGDTYALTYVVAVSVLVETLILYTAVTL